MKVLVTGGAGFIGRWVGEALSRAGHQWFSLDRRPNTSPNSACQSYLVDICDEAALSRAVEEISPDAVIHLAARCDLEGPNLAAYDANIGGVRNLCEIVRRQSIKKLIVTSSQLVCQVGHVPVEDDEYCPNTIYGQSKVQTERITRELDGGGADWCLVRPTTVWGPGMSPHYQGMLRAIRKGVYFHSGSGELRKSYAFIANIAHQYLRLVEAPAEVIHRRMFYLADYEPLSLREYADALQRKMEARSIPTVPIPVARVIALAGDLLGRFGISFPYNSFRLRNIRTEYIFDLAATEQVCGASPVDFETGVAATAAWFLDGAPEMSSLDAGKPG